MERFPSRARELVKAYARPCLVDWVFKFDPLCPIRAETCKTEGLIIRVQVESHAPRTVVLLGPLPFAVSSIRYWSVVVEDHGIYAGITDCWHFDDRHTSTWIEPRVQHHRDGTCAYGLASMNSCGQNIQFLNSSSVPASESLMWNPGRRFDFSVDLSANTLTVAFEHYRLVAAVPNLSAFRPFVYFSTGHIRPTARFIDPCD